MWLELKTIFDTLSISPDVRAIILSATGEKAFTTGLDVQAASANGPLSEQKEPVDVARKAQAIKRHVQEFQDCIQSIEKCEKRKSLSGGKRCEEVMLTSGGTAVICVMHGYAFGLAIDIATCADIRICSSNTKFSVKEVDIGIAADIGTLTRLPKVVGSFSWVKDVALSARIFGAEEAYRVGFVSQVAESKQNAVDAALKTAELLASKSPVAVQGTKELLNHARDHTTADSLRYTGVWNSAAIQTRDMEVAMLSGLKKTKPRFEKL